jgi:hypothetical protein
MLSITPKAILSLREAARQIGESRVTVATDAGVITFDFSAPDRTHLRALPYESQPTRLELTAMFPAHASK